MSKILRDAALIVGVVALAATGIGAAASAGIIGVGVGATATVAGVSAATFSTIGLAASVAAAGITAVSALTAKKPSSAVNPMAWSADPQAGIPYAMGRIYVAGQIVYRDTYLKDNKNEGIGTVYSAGPIQQFEGFYVDGILTTIAGNTVNIADRGKMFIATQIGAQPEASQLWDITAPNVTAASKLSGLAASYITLVYDAKGGTTFTTEPQCGWVIHGVKVYDPRQDDTYPGGSGPQRASDETTWTFSANPYLHALTWLLGRRQNGKLVLGVGVPLAGILVGQYVEGANVADANGWKISGSLSSTDDKWARLKDMLQAGGGEPIRLGAQIGCIINTPRVSLATITVGDVVGDASVQATQAKRDRINAIIPRYTAEQSVTTEKSDGTGLQTSVTWAVTAGSPVIVDDYVVFDGKQRQKEVDYTFVADRTQSQQLARYDIENAREFGPITLPMKLRWMGYKPGDVVTADLPELGLNGQDILLLQRELSPGDGTVTMTARSETTAKHAFALGQTGTPPATPSVTGPALVSTPDPSAWTLVGGVVASANGATVPALIVAGSADSDAIDAILIQYRTSATQTASAGAWIDAGDKAPSLEQLNITGVQDGTAYDVSIAYRRGANTGTPLILGPAVAGQTAVPWQSGVVGDGKPQDGATVGAPTGTPVGDMLAEQVLSAISTIQSNISSLESEVASAVDPDLTDLNNKIAAAQSDATSALSQIGTIGTTVTNLTSTVGDSSSGLVYTVASQATGISALAGSISSLNAAVGDSSSGLTYSVAVQASSISSLSTSVSNLTSTIGNSSSGLVQQVGTNATAISALSYRVDHLSSTVTINANLQPDGGFANSDLGGAGFINFPVGSAVYDVASWGRIYQHTNAGNTALWMPAVNVFAGKPYTISWDNLLFASQGTSRVDIACYDGPNGSGNLTYGPSSPSSGGKDFTDSTRQSWTVTIPSGTQSIRIRLVTEGVSGLTGIGWRRIKLETGTVATAFTDEGWAGSISATISNTAATLANATSAVASTVMSLTSRMGAAESNISSTSATVATHSSSIASLQTSVSAYTPVIANFLYNPTFASGNSNWSYDSGWVFENNIQAKYYNALNNQGAGMGQSGHYFVASPGAYYSLSMEAWTPGYHSGRLVMDIVWLDAGNNLVSYSNRLTITQNNGGNWTRYYQDGQSGGIQAPQGAVYGAARVFLEGATIDGGGSMAVRRLQVERATTAHAWVDYTDSSALQATVQQNTAAIADIKNNRLAAYMDITATAGNQTASIGIVASDSSGNSYSSILLNASNVAITGNLLVAGSVTTGAAATNAFSASWLASNSNTISGQGVQSSNSYRDPETGETIITGSNDLFVLRQTFTLTARADVEIRFACGMSMPSGLKKWHFVPKLDGTPISGRSGAAANDTPSITTDRISMAAGQHTMEVYWAGEDANVYIYDSTLNVSAKYNYGNS